MAAATAVTHERSARQSRGVWSEFWTVKATLDSASVATGAAGTDTVTVPGVALGDQVIALSASVSLAGVTRTAYVSAADTVTIVTDNITGGAVDLASCTVKLVVGRPAF